MHLYIQRKKITFSSCKNIKVVLDLHMHLKTIKINSCIIVEPILNINLNSQIFISYICAILIDSLVWRSKCVNFTNHQHQ